MHLSCLVFKTRVLPGFCRISKIYFRSKNYTAMHKNACSRGWRGHNAISPVAFVAKRLKGVSSTLLLWCGFSADLPICAFYLQVGFDISQSRAIESAAFRIIVGPGVGKSLRNLHENVFCQAA